MRRSSPKLSALTATPSASASRSSSRVLAGESRTIRAGAKPASSASRSSPGPATSQPMPQSAEQPQDRDQRRGLRGEGVQHPHARFGGERVAQRVGTLADPVRVQKAREGALLAQQPFRHREAQHLGEPGGARWASRKGARDRVAVWGWWRRWEPRRSVPSGDERDHGLGRQHPEGERLVEVEPDAGRVVVQIADGQVLAQAQLEVAATGGQQEPSGDGGRPQDGLVELPCQMAWPPDNRGRRSRWPRCTRPRRAAAGTARRPRRAAAGSAPGSPPSGSPARPPAAAAGRARNRPAAR